MKKRRLKNCIRIISKLISRTKKLMITLEKKGKNKNQYIHMHFKDNYYIIEWSFYQQIYVHIIENNT